MLPCLPFHRDCQKLSCDRVAVAAPTSVLGAFGSSCTLLHILHVLMPEDRIMTFFFNSLAPKITSELGSL